jgi:RHS repeat-associated protein
MGQTRYYHFDGVGSTQLLTDSSADVTDSYCNTAFGEPVDTGAENPTVNPFLFVGQLGYYLDPDTADYYVRARNYSPDLVRWLSQDPIGLAGGDANLYGYVGNSPTNAIDPAGLATVSTIPYPPVILRQYRFFHGNEFRHHGTLTTRRAFSGGRIPNRI